MSEKQPEALRLADALDIAHYEDGDIEIDAAALLRTQHADIERLTAALKKANDQAEHFEREWYLRGDAIEKLEADRKMLREVLTQTTRLLGELVAKDAQTYAPYMRVIDAARAALEKTND